MLLVDFPKDKPFVTKLFFHCASGIDADYSHMGILWICMARVRVSCPSVSKTYVLGSDPESVTLAVNVIDFRIETALKRVLIIIGLLALQISPE